MDIIFEHVMKLVIPLFFKRVSKFSIYANIPSVHCNILTHLSNFVVMFFYIIT